MLRIMSVYTSAGKIPLKYCLTYVSMSYVGVLFVGVGVDLRQVAAGLTLVVSLNKAGSWNVSTGVG